MLEVPQGHFPTEPASTWQNRCVALPTVALGKASIGSQVAMTPAKSIAQRCTHAWQRRRRRQASRWRVEMPITIAFKGIQGYIPSKLLFQVRTPDLLESYATHFPSGEPSFR